MKKYVFYFWVFILDSFVIQLRETIESIYFKSSNALRLFDLNPRKTWTGYTYECCLSQRLADDVASRAICAACTWLDCCQSLRVARRLSIALRSRNPAGVETISCTTIRSHSTLALLDGSCMMRDCLNIFVCSKSPAIPCPRPFDLVQSRDSAPTHSASGRAKEEREADYTWLMATLETEQKNPPENKRLRVESVGAEDAVLLLPHCSSPG